MPLQAPCPRDRPGQIYFVLSLFCDPRSGNSSEVRRIRLGVGQEYHQRRAFTSGQADSADAPAAASASRPLSHRAGTSASTPNDRLKKSGRLFVCAAIVAAPPGYRMKAVGLVVVAAALAGPPTATAAPVTPIVHAFSHFELSQPELTHPEVLTVNLARAHERGARGTAAAAVAGGSRPDATSRSALLSLAVLVAG